MNPNYAMGVFYGLISAFLGALFSVINGIMVKDNKPTIITFYELGFGVVFLTLIILFQGDFTAEFFN